MIYKHDDGTYTISSHRVWMPGIYDSKRTANYAFRFSDEELCSLQPYDGNSWRLITFEDLQELRKKQTLNEV